MQDLIVQVILHCTGQTSLCKGDIIVQVDLIALTPTLGRLCVGGGKSLWETGCVLTAAGNHHFELQHVSE